MVIYEQIPMHQPNRTIRSRKRFGVCSYPETYFELFNHESPLRAWLTELQSLTEVESLTALQAKSVATTPESFEALSIRNAQIAIQQIRKKSSIIIEELDSIIDSLPVTIHGLCYLYESFSVTCSRIKPVVEQCRRKGCDYATNKQLSHDVLMICEQTLKFMDTFLAKDNVNNAQIEAYARKLKENFGELVDITIKKECQILISSLDKKNSHLCLKWSLLALWQLTQNDPYMCRLFIENQNIIKNLVDIVRNYCNVSLDEMHQVKGAAVRVLTYLSANREAIKQILEEIIQNKCLSSIVLDESEDIIRKEMVGLLVQLTTPFIDCKENRSESNDPICNLGTKSFINEMVHCLTQVIRTEIRDRRILLMITAALANISFLNTDSIVKYDTLTILLNELRNRHDEFDDQLLKDQIVTLLANMSHHHPLQVVSSGGLIFLLSILHSDMYTSQNGSSNDVATRLDSTRIQQKIAVALARLGGHRSTAKIVYKLNGLNKLVQLCKDAKQRHFSDTVLLASLAAIKRLAQSLGRTPFKELNATDLIDMKLQDSFAQYSARYESLV